MDSAEQSAARPAGCADVESARAGTPASRLEDGGAVVRTERCHRQSNDGEKPRRRRPSGVPIPSVCFTNVPIPSDCLTNIPVPSVGFPNVQPAVSTRKLPGQYRNDDARPRQHHPSGVPIPSDCFTDVPIPSVCFTDVPIPSVCFTNVPIPSVGFPNVQPSVSTRKPPGQHRNNGARSRRRRPSGVPIPSD